MVHAEENWRNDQDVLQNMEREGHGFVKKWREWFVAILHDLVGLVREVMVQLGFKLYQCLIKNPKPRVLYTLISSAFGVFTLFLLVNVGSGGNVKVTATMFWSSIIVTVCGEIFEWLRFRHIPFFESEQGCFYYWVSVIALIILSFLLPFNRLSDSDIISGVILCGYITSYSLRNFLQMKP